MQELLETSDGVYEYRPCGSYSLTDAVALVTHVIAQCRDRARSPKSRPEGDYRSAEQEGRPVSKLLIDARGLTDLPIPTLVDRFLMVEEWAQEARGAVVVVLLVHADYIHPQKFGVKVAAHFGLICDVYNSEAEAQRWLRQEDGRRLAPWPQEPTR